MSETWNERYRQSDFYYGVEPNDFLRLCEPHIKRQGRVLSFGEGEGRNALYLAKHGHSITCIDGSQVAKEKCLSLCKDYKQYIDYKVIDLNDFETEDMYDAIISIWCHVPSQLRKKLFELSSRKLRPGGFLIFEAYRPDQLEYTSGGPKDLDMLCSLENISPLLFDLQPVLFQETTRWIEEGKGHYGKSATVQLFAKKS